MKTPAVGERRALADRVHRLGFEGGIPRASEVRSIILILYVTEYITSNSHSFVASRLTETVNDFKDSYHRETHRYDALGREIEKAEWNRDGSVINRRNLHLFNRLAGQLNSPDRNVLVFSHERTGRR